MITIAELFPLYSTGTKWMNTFKPVSLPEIVRLEKEYTIHTRDKNTEEYTVDDEFHRRDGPAFREYDNYGYRLSSQWFLHGLNHCDDGPAIITYYEDYNEVENEFWMINGILHREDGPAITRYYEDGDVFEEKWYTHGIENGRKLGGQWFKNE